MTFSVGQTNQQQSLHHTLTHQDFASMDQILTPLLSFALLGVLLPGLNIQFLLTKGERDFSRLE